jgi:hypothetical protein
MAESVPAGAKIKLVGESAEAAGTPERPLQNNESASPPLPRRVGPARVLALVSEYAELVGALRARCDEVGISFETLDEIAGFTDRYSSKLLSPSRRPIRRLGHMSMGVLLASLGVRLLPIEDPEALARVRARYRPRKQARPRGWSARTPMKQVWTTPEIEDPSNPDK